MGRRDTHSHLVSRLQFESSDFQVAFLKRYLLFLQVVKIWSKGMDHLNLEPGTQ